MKLIILVLSAIFLLNAAENDNLSLHFNAQTVHVWQSLSQNVQYLIAGQIVRHLPAHHTWNLINIFDKKYQEYDTKLREVQGSRIVNYLKWILYCNTNHFDDIKAQRHSHEDEYVDFLERALDHILAIYYLNGSRAIKRAQCTAKYISPFSKKIVLKHIDELWPKSKSYPVKKWFEHRIGNFNTIDFTTLQSLSQSENLSYFKILNKKRHETKETMLCELALLPIYGTVYLRSEENDLSSYSRIKVPNDITLLDALAVAIATLHEGYSPSLTKDVESLVQTSLNNLISDKYTRTHVDQIITGWLLVRSQGNIDFIGSGITENDRILLTWPIDTLTEKDLCLSVIRKMQIRCAQNSKIGWEDFISWYSYQSFMI